MPSPGIINLVRLCTANDDEEGQMKEFITLLMRKGLILRVDRMYKKPKPGKKRLTKWPKKLVPVKDKSMLVTTLLLGAADSTKLTNYLTSCQVVELLAQYVSVGVAFFQSCSSAEFH